MSRVDTQRGILILRFPLKLARTHDEAFVKTGAEGFDPSQMAQNLEKKKSCNSIHSLIRNVDRGRVGHAATGPGLGR
jgi:hypothetical protein